MATQAPARRQRWLVADRPHVLKSGSGSPIAAATGGTPTMDSVNTQQQTEDGVDQGYREVAAAIGQMDRDIVRMLGSWDYWSDAVGEPSTEADKAALVRTIRSGQATVASEATMVGGIYGRGPFHIPERGTWWLFRVSDGARMIAPRPDGSIDWDHSAPEQQVSDDDLLAADERRMEGDR